MLYKINSIKWGDYMKQERKTIVKLLEAEQTNTYKILAEFLAKKFSMNGFDKANQK